MYIVRTERYSNSNYSWQGFANGQSTARTWFKLTFPEVPIPRMQQIAMIVQAASRQSTMGQWIPPESAIEAELFKVTR